MRSLVVISFFAAAVVAQFDNPQGDFNAHDISQFQHKYNKNFFSYSAPESEFEDPEANYRAINSIKKPLRVVFVKAPENNGLEKNVLQLAKAASEDQTFIYVLNRQSDPANFANKLNDLRSNQINKPEVHFVKYKTELDAENAKRTIQSQYDALPGSSAPHHLDSASVLDFPSRSDQLQGFTASSSNQVFQAYLPPVNPRRRRSVHSFISL